MALSKRTLRAVQLVCSEPALLEMCAVIAQARVLVMRDRSAPVAEFVARLTDVGFGFDEACDLIAVPPAMRKRLSRPTKEK